MVPGADIGGGGVGLAGYNVGYSATRLGMPGRPK